MVQLGKFNRVQQRAALSVAGLAAVGLGLVTAYGLCVLLGFMYTQLHTVLPFLLLGIGVDDMFVIVQSFDNLEGAELSKTLARRFGLTMRHAGVAITITTVTDLVAFGLGASTVLPTLSSFGVYAAVGVTAVYFYMATFFLAFFSLDQKRAEADRDACLCWVKREDFTPNKCSQISLMEYCFRFLAKVRKGRGWKKDILTKFTLAKQH